MAGRMDSLLERLAERTSDWASLLEVYARVARARPDVAERVELLAVRALVREKRLSDPSGALDELVRSFALDPNNGTTHEEILRLAAATGRWEDALKVEAQLFALAEDLPRKQTILIVDDDSALRTTSAITGAWPSMRTSQTEPTGTRMPAQEQVRNLDREHERAEQRELDAEDLLVGGFRRLARVLVHLAQAPGSIGSAALFHGSFRIRARGSRHFRCCPAIRGSIS